MEWVFPIDGATARIGPAMALQLRMIEGVVTADVDVQSAEARVTFDANRVCGGEILAVIRACGCLPLTRSPRRTTD